MTPEFTIIIATRDRPEALLRSLGALRRQTGVGPLQLIVVDDGSREPDEVARIAAEAGAERVRQPTRGQSAARNVGIARADAPFVGFLDDDSEPSPLWAAAMLRRLRAGERAVTGPIVAHPRGGSLGVASQFVANAIVDSDAADKGRTKSTPSANLACRLDLAYEIPFDESYTQLGPGIGAEDRDWCARVAAAGIELAFASDAEVRHVQDVTLREFWRRQYRYGRGARVYRVRHEGGRLAPTRFYAKLILDGFRKGPLVGGLVALAQVATAAGYVREAAARRHVAPEVPLSRRTGSPGENRAA